MTTTVPPGVDVAQELEHAAGGALVEVAGRLVGDQDGGIVHQRPRDRDPLLLPARELAGIGPALGREADLGEHPHHPGGDGVAPGAGHLEGERDVLRGGAVLQQAEVLEHDAQAAAQLGHLVRPELADVVAGDPHLARRGLLLGEQQLHDGGLAGAGVAGEKDELALGHPEGDVLQGEGAVGIRLVDVGEADHGRKVKRAQASLPSAWRRSSMMSSPSSRPQLSRRKPSGMPTAARPSAPRSRAR